MYGDNLSIYFQ